MNVVSNPYEIYESIIEAMDSSTNYDKLTAYLAAILELGISPGDPNQTKKYLDQIEEHLS